MNGGMACGDIQYSIWKGEILFKIKESKALQYLFRLRVVFYAAYIHILIVDNAFGNN